MSDINMIITTVFCVLSFGLGVVITLFFKGHYKIKIVQDTKKEKAVSNISSGTLNTQYKDERIANIDKLLNEIRQGHNLSISIRQEVFDSLKVIAKTPNWDIQLDEETIKNLNKIYDKWRRSINSSNNYSKPIQVLGDGGFYDYDIDDDEGEEYDGTWYTQDTTTGEFDLYENYKDQ